MIGTIITSIVKPAVAGLVTLSMSLNSMLTGIPGEYAKVQNKAMQLNPSKTETQINFMLDLAAVEKLSGQDFDLEEIKTINGIYADGKIDFSATLYTFGDLDNTKLALSFTENLSDGYAVYIDEDGLAVTPALVDAALEIMSVFNAESADMYKAYTKYFADNGVYLNWDNMVGVKPGEYSDEIALTAGVVTDAVKVLCTEENVKALYDLCAPVIDVTGKCYAETTVDGIKGYGAKLNGMDMLSLSAEIMKITNTKEYANKLFDYMLGLVDDIDFVKYVDFYSMISGSNERLTLPEGITNQQLTLMLRSSAEAYREEFVDYYTSAASSDFDSAFDVIVSGKDENNLLDEEAEKLLASVRPFLENSYVESVIREVDGKVVESSKLSVSDGKVVYGEIEVVCGVSKYEGILPNTEDVVPFDKRVEYEEIDNKLGFENAQAKGVNSIEINWNSWMTPEDSNLYIANQHFYVYYNTSLTESLKKDPAFIKLPEEEQKLILGMYTDADHEFKVCNSTAELIENSVYLPLRQLMENAGYEVSWDGEARKAYVTVNGQKIEMTGVIVNDRTYVKVRDFEKLGATVEYEEFFYTQEAYNSFDKECTATIVFNK